MPNMWPVKCQIDTHPIKNKCIVKSLSTFHEKFKFIALKINNLLIFMATKVPYFETRLISDTLQVFKEIIKGERNMLSQPVVGAH